jgi:hypothetical protein
MDLAFLAADGNQDLAANKKPDRGTPALTIEVSIL